MENSMENFTKNWNKTLAREQCSRDGFLVSIRQIITENHYKRQS